MKGIDISPYQGNINFTALKQSGIEIVYIKSSEGATWKSDTFRSYYNQAISAGLKVGVYHFLRANAMESEVANLISMTSGLHFDCKFAIDCELTLNQSAQQITNNIRNFSNIMKSKGLECVLYTYSSFLKDNILYNQISDIPLWIAEYGVSKPDISVPYVGFQYSEKGSVSGINGACDVDEFSDGILIGNNTNTAPCNITQIVESPLQKASAFVGNRGAELQRDLIALGYNCGGYGADGKFGQGSYDSLVKFQSDKGLSADGLAGDATFAKLNQLLVKPVSSGDSTIRNLQHQLNILLKCGITEDGFMGNATKSQTINFQSAMKLTADGIAGNDTNSAINQILSRPLDGVPYPHYEYATKYLQYRCGGTIDGVFGNGTKANVANWQSRHSLTPDGIVGSGTWSKLLDENC
jgi:GH25 family lysozyme M1 (1,4-beta-N-acetylmuramidase)/peptidoglycan hydrolase-like protein with peptidoglycan-binding domain